MSSDLGSQENYFVTPTDPDGFAVSLPPPSFRSIDFSALEFNTLQRALIEYIKTYYSDEFNDFVASNGFMMLTELVSYIGAVLAQRSDILSNEQFLPTALTREAVNNHLNLIGQSIRRQTPATVQVFCSVSSPVATDIKIPAGFNFSLTGPDGSPLIYEIFNAPYDWESPITIPARKMGVIAWGIEGSFGTPINVVSSGGSNQIIAIEDEDVLEQPIIVTVDNERWSKVDYLEKYGVNDKVYIVRFNVESADIIFGDDINGKSPLSGQSINVEYRSGGGSRGRIGTGAIDSSSQLSPEPPSTAPITVRFQNTEPSSGGFDNETIEEAKKRAPREWSTHGNIVSDSDYINIAESFKHPVYGGVSKAAVSLLTHINANIINISILAEGPNGKPVKPNMGLKEGLRTHLKELNVFTDDIKVLDGSIKAVDVSLTVVLYKNADATFVKEEIDNTINNFFNLSRWSMGQPFYVSNLYSALMDINGVRYVNIFNPTGDIISDEVSEDDNIISHDELITLGNKDIRIYYEKSR